MTSFVLRWGPPALAIGCLGMLTLIFTSRDLTGLAIDASDLQTFKILFISLILEAFPFILLGVLVSSLLQVFVSDRMIQRLTPKHPIGGVLFGSLLGLLFPLCECGMIPVVRRLIRKGMPAYIGIVFILAGPILNPIVYTATFTAFRSQPQIAYSRMGMAFAVTFIIGLLLYRFMRQNPLRHSSADHNHSHNHGHSHSHSNSNGQRGRLTTVLSHASDEFFEMGKYLIFGALLTGLIQTSLSRETLTGIGGHPWLSSLFMMGIAFILSICSTSDAFVAASFAGMFSTGSLLAFLTFGPMIDMKNTLMLLSTFKTKIVVSLILLCAVLVYITSFVMEKFILS